MLDAIRVAADSLETTLDGLLSGCRHLIHGCTIATNAVVERDGVTTGLITTRGHEDAIPIGKVMQKVAGQSEREMIHQSHLDKADPPIVDRRMIKGVAERLDRAGDVVVAMDEEEAAGRSTRWSATARAPSRSASSGPSSTASTSAGCASASKGTTPASTSPPPRNSPRCWASTSAR